MTSVGALLLEIESAGLKVEPRGENLWVEPSSRLTQVLRERIVEAKLELITFLRHQSDNSQDDFAVSFDDQVTFEEVLNLPVYLFAHLPIPSSLALTVLGIDRTVLFTASQSVYHRAQAKGMPVFGPKEYEAICWAAENKRAFEADFVGWCRNKIAEPQWGLTEVEAMGSISPDPPQGWKFRDWKFRDLFSHLGATLRLVEMERKESQ